MSWQGYTWSKKNWILFHLKNTKNYTCTSNYISCSAFITPPCYPTLDPWPIMAHHGPWHLDEGPFRLQQIRQVKERRDGTPMLRPQLRLFRCQGCTVKLFGLAGCRGTFKTSRLHLAYTLILLTFTISTYIYICNIHWYVLSISICMRSRNWFGLIQLVLLFKESCQIGHWLKGARMGCSKLCFSSFQCSAKEPFRLDATENNAW